MASKPLKASKKAYPNETLLTEEPSVFLEKIPLEGGYMTTGVKNIKSQTDMSTLIFIYFGSTNLESAGTYGISHLMEHLVCKRIIPISDALQTDCIEWYALTGDNYIVFEFSGLEEFLSKHREKLIKLMYEPMKITKSILENEKAIVSEEYDDTFANLDSANYHLFFRRYYNHYHPIGYKKDIMATTLKTVASFYKKQYARPDMIINFSKTHIQSDKGLKFADRYGIRKRLIKKDIIDDKEVEIVRRMLASETKSLFMFREIEIQDLPIAAIVAKMLGDGLQSPIYDEVREKRGLVYFIGASVVRKCGLGGFLITASTSSKNTDAVINTVGSIFKHRKKHLTKKRLDIIRKSAIVRRKMDECINGNIAESHSYLSYQLSQLIERVTLDDIHVFCEKYLRDEKDFTLTDVF